MVVMNLLFLSPILSFKEVEDMHLKMLFAIEEYNKINEMPIESVIRFRIFIFIKGYF